MMNISGYIHHQMIVAGTGRP
ncbi:hypothetical protein MTR67_007375 [Solanum verrucosum]|uniref:Uncharacterized protein n=1 Tax=Solanum verrucosum TaxID=315347 RepID=A0AAF0TI53_SOLVR|nr:hypothetical protein MTR67_007375 [Solanum verrucosum]